MDNHIIQSSKVHISLPPEEFCLVVHSGDKQKEAKEGRGKIYIDSCIMTVLFSEWKFVWSRFKSHALQILKDFKHVLLFCSYLLFWTLQVSGNNNVKQVVLSVRMYNRRPTFLIRAMQALFDIIQEDRELGLNKDLMCSVSQ